MAPAALLFMIAGVTRLRKCLWPCCQRASDPARGLALTFEVGKRYREPATGETWIDFPVAGAAAWADRSASGHPFNPRAQRARDAGRIQRVLAVGVVCSAREWAILADWVRTPM